MHCVKNSDRQENRVTFRQLFNHSLPYTHSNEESRSSEIRQKTGLLKTWWVSPVWFGIAILEGLSDSEAGYRSCQETSSGCQSVTPEKIGTKIKRVYPLAWQTYQALKKLAKSKNVDASSTVF